MPPNHTPSRQTSRRSKDIGTSTESAVVRYLQSHGWPYSERRALYGADDRGDITGTPGICWEVKGGHAATVGSDRKIADWLEETAHERRNAGAEVGVLVVRRGGIGEPNAHRWWAVLTVTDVIELSGGRGFDPPLPPALGVAPVRMLLGDLVAMLRHAGWGDEPTATCGHVWPADLDGAHCEKCGLAYAEWSE